MGSNREKLHYFHIMSGSSSTMHTTFGYKIRFESSLFELKNKLTQENSSSSLRV